MRTIFISLDTVCADRLSCIGAGEVHTPNLEQFAQDAAVFTNAFASDIPTQPSHTSVFTGRVGINTGIVSHFHPPARLEDGVPWLPGIFRSFGHRTGAVDHLFSMKEWFIRGYDDYIVPPGRSRSPASVISGLGLPWLETNRNEEFFLFLHYWDAHIPYVPPEPFKSKYTAHLIGRIDPHIVEKIKSHPTYPLAKQNLYDHLDAIPNLEYVAALHHAEIAYLDHELGVLFDRLDDMRILDDSMIVIFGDHGEVMTEHDAWFDHAGLYDSVVHVPLMIRAPGVVRPCRSDALVSLVDVLPTVLDLQQMNLHVEDEPLDGRSLMSIITGRTTEHRDALVLSECTWQAKRAVRTREWKYIQSWDPGIYSRYGPELYDLQNDPLEQLNVVDSRPDIARSMAEQLGSWLEKHLDGRPDPMDAVVEYGLPGLERVRRLIRVGTDQPSPPSIDLRSHPLRGERARDSALAHD